MDKIVSYINGISTHYYDGISNIFMLNFTLLAFIITAITILLMLNKGMIIQFKQADLMDDVLNYFSKSLHWNFFSGVFALLAWVANIKEYAVLCSIVFIISFLLLIIALKYTYDAYRFLIFFVKKQ